MQARLIRPHQKTRTGCNTCKRRRVKCDETQPICKTCSGRELECTYGFQNKKIKQLHAERQQQRSLSPATPTHELALAPTTPSLPMVPSQSLTSTATPEFDMLGLELLHHYTVTCTTGLEGNPTSSQVWRSTVPQLAFQYPFLMDILMANSAAHIGSVSNQKYRLIAKHYYDRGLVAFRNVFRTHSKENVTLLETLFATSVLTATFVAATQPWDHGPLVIEAKGAPRSLTWVMLSRGAPALLTEYWEILRVGRLAPLLGIGTKYSEEDPQSLPLPANLEDLALPTALVEGEDCTEFENPEVVELYRESIEKLQNSWEVFSRKRYQIAGAMMWTAGVKDKFLCLVREGKPRALVLYAHWCGIVYQLEKYIWWLKVDMVNELDFIEATVGKKWEAWLEFPTRIIRQKYGGERCWELEPDP